MKYANRKDRRHAYQHHRRNGFTLLEVSLVVGILLVISAMAMPSFMDEYQRELLPGSGRQLRSLITMTRAHAALDGKRYRIRFPEEDEENIASGWRQPIIEREDDPLGDPGAYVQVTLPWAVGETLLGNVWCAEIRHGRPTIDMLQNKRSQVEDAVDGAAKDFAPQRRPLMIDPDGSSDWATFVITDAPSETSYDQLAQYASIEVILEGPTGQAWLQRPLFAEELDLFEEKNWPVVLRQDFLTTRMLTENDVLELRDASANR